MLSVVVTGASQGIGRAMAVAFGGEPGARVALLARSVDGLEATAEAVRAAGGEALVLPCDVTDDEAVREAAERILGDGGAPDVLVNNAGTFTPGSISDTSPASFRAQVEVNLTSAFVVTQAFLEAMTARGTGTIFYLASVASIRGYPGGVAYCAAKHGLLGLSRVVREETKGTGVRVTALMPGATLTPSWAGTDLPDERFMPPEDIARAALDVYRLSDRTVVEELLLRPQEGDV